MRWMTTGVAALAAVVATGAANARGLIYQQSPHSPGAPGGTGWSTFEGTRNGVFYNRQIADDFTVGQGGWEVNGLRMHGIWLNQPPTNTPQFNIIIMDDANGAPGEKVVTFRATNVSVQTGQSYFNRTEQIFDFSLPTFALGQGKYWLSIQPIANRDFWWLTSNDSNSPVNGESIFLRDPTGHTANWPTHEWGPLFGTISKQPYDLAFSIFGTAIPAPGAIGLVGLAGWMAGTGRRRRAR